MPETFWNGEPINAARGTGTVDGVPGCRVVRVFYGTDQFDLDDTNEQGWRKVTGGLGLPRYAHRNVAVEPHTFKPDDWKSLIAEWARRSGIDPDA